jgi:hypothetical protein
MLYADERTKLWEWKWQKWVSAVAVVKFGIKLHLVANFLSKITIPQFDQNSFFHSAVVICIQRSGHKKTKWRWQKKTQKRVYMIFRCAVLKLYLHTQLYYNKNKKWQVYTYLCDFQFAYTTFLWPPIACMCLLLRRYWTVCQVIHTGFMYFVIYVTFENVRNESCRP